MMDPVNTHDSRPRCPAAATTAPPWLYRGPRLWWETWFLIGLTVLLGIVLLPLLSRVPRAYGDDSWSTMAGYTLAFEGVPRNPGQVGRGGTEAYLLQPRLFPNVVCAAAYRLIGFGLTQSRLVAVVFCGVFVFAVYGVMRHLFGPLAAAAVTVMTVVDPWVFLTGRTCREEVFLAALLWLSWWFILQAIDRGSAARALAGGFCTGLACWTHPNAVVFTAAAIIALCLVAWPHSLIGSSSGKCSLFARLFSKKVGAFLPTFSGGQAGVAAHEKAIALGRWWPWALAGVAIGLAPYLAYVGYVQNTSDIRLVDQIADRMGAHARGLAEILAVEKARWANFLRLPQRAPLLVLYVWAAGWLLIRGGRGDHLLLAVLICSCVLLPLLVRVSHGRYLVVLVPLLAGMVWRALPRVASAGLPHDRIGPVLSRPGRAGVLAVLVLLVYAGMSLMPTVAIVYAHRGADYDASMARLTQHVPQDASVMGDVTFWIGLRDRRFRSSVPPYFDYWRSVDDAERHIAQYRPEYLIQSSAGLGEVGGLGPRSRDLTGDCFGAACERVARRTAGQVVTEFYHRDFGAVRLWRLHWSLPTTAISPTSPG